MKHRAAVAALVFAAMTALTGCAGDGSERSEPAPARNVRVLDDTHLFETKQIVEGTELVCVRDDSYGSTTCNWELWNKLRDTPRK